VHRFVVTILLAAATAATASAEDALFEEPSEGYTSDERSHWSFQPVEAPAVPEFNDPSKQAWIRTDVDAFILSMQDENGLQHAPPADRRTLIRRVYYDLLGLPPTPGDIDVFLADQSADAYASLIERLLADPRYGERWGQHWLDVVRFAESEGYEYDRHLPDAWRYRDYVIAAFNSNKPYDRFVIEQLAGDELSARGEGTERSRQEAQIAAGLHRLGPIRRNAGNTLVAFSRNEVLTEMTDMIGSGFLGVTLGCARCHEHAFDPIRQKDYYRLQTFLAATQPYDHPLTDAETQEKWKAQNDAIEAEVKRLNKSLATATGEANTQLTAELTKLESERPEPPKALFTVRNVVAETSSIHVLNRGNERQPVGEPLGMRVLGVLLPDDTTALPAETPDPKTKLARWITSPENPLTARVMVNRIWHYHFGRGLVDTPNDFGANGSSPSHPELLDWLAHAFVQSGWDINAVHRLILLSSTYRQSSRVLDNAHEVEVDSDNRLLWRFPRRRLEAEEIRDSLLAISGRLNAKRGGPSIIVPVDDELVSLLYKPTQWAVTPDARQHNRRSIYLIAKRNLRLPFLDVFDQPSLQTSCDRRIASTHAPQALELLNGRLSNELADAFAERLRSEAGESHQAQIEQAFELTTGRPPTKRERLICVQYLESSPLQEFALSMFNVNAFLYVE